MQLEQRMEQTEALIETNEENKRRLSAAHAQYSRAEERARVANAQAQRCQNQLQQAVAARNAAAQRTDSEGNPPDLSSYDAAISSAQAELRSAQMESLRADREQLVAAQEVQNAETAAEQSARELYSVGSELQGVMDKYGVEISKTQQLLSLPYAQLASPLLQQLGIGRSRVYELQRRVAASLGIAPPAGPGDVSTGGGGGHGVRARYLSRGGSNTLRHSTGGGGSYGSTGGGGFSGSASSGAGPSAGSTSGAGAAASTAGNAGGASSAPAAKEGWCPSNSFSAVQVGQDGQKTVTMTIGGTRSSFPCTKAGMAAAHDRAVSAGDSDMMARTSAMFEIETLREDLELGSGDSSYPQLGGYHRDVKEQDPAGFESHHIPARSVQDVNAGWLPALSISDADHKLTSSYAGKQKHVYKPLIPGGISPVTYKESITQNIEKGSSGYIDSVRAELLDLRVTTDHRYDGAVSGYLDAVIDMLATRGIPEAKR